MPQFIRHHVIADTHNNWALPILAGILIGCLLAFVVNFFLKEARRESSAAQAPFAVSAVPESKPAAEFKKAVRYEAIISNWKQYRATQTKE
jgi:hypothetical protein